MPRQSRLPLRVTCALPLLIAIAGCQSSHVDMSRMGPSETTSKGAMEGRSMLSLPLSVPGTNTRLVPFALEDRKGWFDDRDPFDAGGYSRVPASASASLHSQNSALLADDGRARPVPFSWSMGVRWHNCIFKDLGTGEEWTLLDRRGVVSRWFAFGAAPGRGLPPICQALVFIVTNHDSNGDGLLNDLDASVAVLTDQDGRRPRPISPPASQVWGVTFDHEAGAVNLLVVTDSNADGRFTELDTPVPYALRLGGPEPAARLVSEESQRKVEGLLK